MTSMTKKHLEILEHTYKRAANRHFCGDSEEMKTLCEKGLMKSVGFKSYVPDEYFTITLEGIQFLHELSN